MTLPADGPHFRLFTDYARWASNEIAEAMMKRAIDADASRELPTSDCDWGEDDDTFFLTGCNRSFVFIEGNFEDNGFLFCPFCGGHITNHVNETGTDE